VNEVQADEELGLAGRQLPHGVEFPHLLQECFSHCVCAFIVALRAAAGRRPPAYGRPFALSRGVFTRLSRALLSTLFAIQCAACGSTSVTQVSGPDNIRCQTTLGTAPTIPAAGGRVTVGVVAARECTWSATSEASWIQVSPASGQGEASLTLTAAANPQAAPRTGNIVVNGQRFTMSQEPAPCQYQLSHPATDVPAQGGSTSVQVTSLGGCPWTTTSNISWIHVTPATGTGSGDVALVIDPNSGSARSAQVTIAGVAFTVNQAAPAPDPAPAPVPGPAPAPLPVPSPSPQCSYSIDPVTRTFKDKGGDGTVKVITGSTCPWSATANDAWVRITENATGTGTRDVKYKVEANQTGSQRIGTITVAGQTHWIVQQAAD
jgi:hypothetical protein